MKRKIIITEERKFGLNKEENLLIKEKITLSNNEFNSSNEKKNLNKSKLQSNINGFE